MSRAFRKRIGSVLELLEKANEEIKLLLKEQGRSETLQGLLADCQEAAEAIGNAIEAVYGQETDLVRELEAYCENLYQLLNAENETILRKTQEGLTKQVGKLYELAGELLSDHLEVVFLPYKASMWDSMESVWNAARRDRRAKTYVIPVPYYDKNPDGSLGQMHYEIGLFPKEVPVVSYEMYNFELRQPDIIVIHNPYDDRNYVTTVHPYFYSDHLKKITERLVYIPYFVLDGDGGDDYMGFALTPGVVHADYVIVQNEKERGSYLQYLEQYYPQNNWRKKLLPLGSPKIEKVCSLDRDYSGIPEEWRERIAGKKVIFYNTTVGSLMQGKDTYLSKLENVFMMFRGREDAVVLWRPHPLMEATISSMFPELKERYQNLREWFVKEQIGILDETPDMYGAIAVSSAYYGDWSSVLWLYKETGKPAMVQSINQRCLVKQEGWV